MKIKKRIVREKSEFKGEGRDVLREKLKKLKSYLKEALGLRWYEKIDGTPSETIEAINFLLLKYLTDRDNCREENKAERVVEAYKVLLDAYNRKLIKCF